MKKLAVIAALAVAGTLSAQSPFYVNYQWQYGQGSQPNCTTDTTCDITFPAQSGQPSASVVVNRVNGVYRLYFRDFAGNHGAQPVVQPTQSTDGNLVTSDFKTNAMTIYNSNGSVIGTMSETFSVTVENMGSRWGELYVPRAASLQ